MIQFIEIDDKEYPFMFSFRAVFTFMNGSNLETLQEVDESVNLEFDSMLKLFEQASAKGAKKDDSPKMVLDAEQIEDHIDEDPFLFMRLQKALENSKVMKAMNGEEPDEKK